MWAIVRRAVVPGLLLSGGLASLIYGALFHEAPVVTEKETETTIDVPLALPPARPFGDGPSFGESPSFPGGPLMGEAPAFVKKTVKRVDLVTIDESEPSLIREVTVGGVALQKSGELKRTYSGNAGPALCPT
jgi:hypothetical protein